MTITVKTGWPASHQAGDTLRFDILKGDFDPSVDVMNVYLSSNANNYTFQATDNTEYFRFDVVASSTGGWQKGLYTLQASVKCADGSVFTVRTASLEVLPNLSVGNADPRSHARRVLESIEAVIEGTASSDVLAYEIAGRRLERYPITELLRLRSIYQKEFQAESGAPKFIKFRFK